MSFRPQPLPWSTDSFPGFLSPNSLDVHYQLYVREIDEMNRLAQKYPQLQNLSLAQIVNDYPNEIGNTAARALNHEFFWRILAPPAQGGIATGRLYELILNDYSTFDEFVQKFNEKAANHVGSGWVWLVYDTLGEFLLTESGDEHYNPIVNGRIPLLALDLWEHSYMPDYGLDKNEYIRNFWNYINWKYLEQIADAQIFGDQLRVRLTGQS